MNTGVKFIAPRYFLGETECSWHEIAGWQLRADGFAMAPQPELWGWGKVRTTRYSREQMAILTAQETLAAAKCQPEKVDGVIFCSTRFPGGPDEHVSFLAAVIAKCGLVNATTVGLTLGRCTNLLQALSIARALVLSGAYQRLLVITIDRMEEESERLENFALFSDGAASCLVVPSDYPVSGFAMLASAESHQLQSEQKEISSSLACQVNDKIFSAVPIVLADIDRLFHTNIYLPLCILKELQAGFSREQLFTDNIPRIGHCFGADPLINLIDVGQVQGLRDHAYYLLAASVPGARVAILLRKEAA
jgi:3-oxoacyl-[acyl-carrier-protein] synthase-3